MICAWHTCNNSTPVGQRGPKKFCNRKCRNKYHVDRRRKMLKIKALEYKGKKCGICGYSKCIAALEFHHLDPSQKEFQIGAGNTMSWSRLEAELDKCTLLCANCHREVHARVS